MLLAAYPAAAVAGGSVGAGKQEHLPFARMIPLGVKMFYVFCQHSPQRCLPKEHQLGEAFLLHRAHPNAPRMRSDSDWQFQGLYSAGRQRVSERLTELRIPVVQQIAARMQKSPTFQCGVARHLLHPARFGMIRDPRDRHTAAVQVKKEQHIVGHQPVPRDDLSGD